MSLVIWNNSFSTNIKLIDEQHKKWLEIINVLHNAMLQGKGKTVLNDVIESLKNYTKLHFKTEEKLLSDNYYPDYKSHKKIHDGFINWLSNIQDKNNKEEKGLLPVEIILELKDWLINHIKHTDKLYSSFLNSKGIN